MAPAVFDGSASAAGLRAAPSGPHPGARPVLVLRASWLFDGWSDRLVERPLVFIEDGRITAVESGDLAPPQDAEVVDLGEVTLLPGLIDTHVHLGFDASTAPVAHLQAATDDALLLRMRANAATMLDFIDTKKMSFPDPPTLAAAPLPLPEALSCSGETPTAPPA